MSCHVSEREINRHRAIKMGGRRGKRSSSAQFAHGGLVQPRKFPHAASGTLLWWGLNRRCENTSKKAPPGLRKTSNWPALGQICVLYQEVLLREVVGLQLEEEPKAPRKYGPHVSASWIFVIVNSRFGLRCQSHPQTLLSSLVFSGCASFLEGTLVVREPKASSQILRPRHFSDAPRCQTLMPPSWLRLPPHDGGVRKAVENLAGGLQRVDLLTEKSRETGGRSPSR